MEIGLLHPDGIFAHARAHNPISHRRGALGNGAGAASFRASTDRANASDQRALTRGKSTSFF
jgi:hypothetical protein